MKSVTKKGIILGVIIALLLAIVAFLSVTVAYLSSRRQATGYINFANGILIKYENIEAKPLGEEPTGNLLYQKQEGQNEHLELTDVEPGDTIKLLNPKLTVEEGSAAFALRIKLVVTNTTGGTENKYYKNEDIKNFLQSILQGEGTLAVNDGWTYKEDYYYYYTQEGQLAEVTYDTTKEGPIYLFKGDTNDQEHVTLTLVDEVEELEIKGIKFELYVEAISFEAAGNWGFGD